MAVITIVMAAMPAVIYWTAGIALQTGGPGISIGTIVAFVSLQQGLFRPAVSLLSTGVQIQASLALFQRIFEYLDLPIDITEPDEPIHLDQVKGEVRFENVEIHYELPKDLPSVDGDATQLGQVVTNLVANALESLGPGPTTITIRTGETVLAESLPNLIPGLGESLPAGRYVFLEVKDSGSGMTQETLSRIFDPFFTTKFTGRGLGLAAVLGIVRSHEGGIEIDSRVGKGTLFRVLFPARSASDRRASAAETETRPPAARPRDRA